MKRKVMKLASAQKIVQTYPRFFAEAARGYGRGFWYYDSHLYGWALARAKLVIYLFTGRTDDE